jgi:hypothetical protein
MGRARSQTQKIAVGAFNAALGSRRGSVEAQTRRDHEETKERVRRQAQAKEIAKQSLHEFREKILHANMRNGGFAGGLAVIDDLVAYYRNHELHTKENYQVLLEKLAEQISLRGPGLIHAAADGDPEGWPGLTTPIVEAIGKYFTDTDDHYTIVRERAEDALTICFGRQHRKDIEHCKRIAPICEGLATVIKMQPRHAPESMGEGPSLTAARLLQSVPDEIIEGPLQPWVRALAGRARAGKLDERELSVLDVARIKHEDGSGNSDPLAALAPYFAKAAES